MKESRTKNTIKNVRTGAIVQIINKLMLFVVRTVFIKVLNTEYLGVNGLFTNVLTILSFAELGIGTAIIFNMYKPVAENNHEKIKSLMHLYKKSYNTIGIVVFLLGMLVIPFMGIIVKDAPNIKENLNYIYILFLLNTSISYFFTYKKSIIYAHQKQSTIDNIDSVFYIVKCLCEILFLMLTKNYIVYLCIEITSTFVENIIISRKADKMFPYLKDNDVKKLSKEVIIHNQQLFDSFKEKDLKFSFRKGTNYTLSNNGKIAEKTNGGNWWNCTIIGNIVIPKNKISKWKIKLNKFKITKKINTVNTFIGIGPNNPQNENCFYEHCWSLSCGEPTIWKNKEEITFDDYPGNLKDGDIIEVIVDMIKGNLSFKINNTDYGLICSDIPTNEELYPVVIINDMNQIVEILD